MTTGMIAALSAMLLAGISIVTFGLLHARRQPPAQGRVPEGAVLMPVTLALPVADEVAARIEGLIAEHTRMQNDVLVSLRADIQHLKSDVEWLAGERMIEQAIALAQSGANPDEIGRELGMTHDAAETITLFRKH